MLSPAYKTATKSPQQSGGSSLLNTTAPICITSLNAPASPHHSRTPSTHADQQSRNRKIAEAGSSNPAIRRDPSYLKGAAIGEKLQKYAASRPQTGKRGGSGGAGSSQNLTTDSSHTNLRNKWIRYSSGSSTKVSSHFQTPLARSIRQLVYPATWDFE